jgi:lysophospholipase L1-like esterase
VERRADSYGGWSKIAAENTGAFFIDLNELVAVKYEQLGKEKVKTFFPKDHTHTGIDGAIFNAETVAESLKKIRKIGLEEYIILPKK